MIRLTKLALPAAIEAKIAERTLRLAVLLANNDEVPASLANAYRDREIKVLLREETADKCAYCESKVPHVDYGDVEHIISKAAKPLLRFDYSNLTYACGVCNTKKGDFYSEEMPLINPYLDEPSDHLMAIGPMVMRKPASDRGLLTQRRLDLNRTELVERRTERVEQVAALIDQIARTNRPEIKTVLAEEVARECGSNKEYALVVRRYVDEALPHA